MTDRTYPTLAHAMAALDELPIVGSADAAPGQPGVDYDALVRARRVLPHFWAEGGAAAGARLEGVAMTPQFGVSFLWTRGDARFEMTVDPLALYAFRLDTSSTTKEWTRPTIDQAVADARATLGLPALTTPVQGPAVDAASVRAQPQQVAVATPT